MALTIRQTATAICPRVPASFLGIGGVEPYLYEVVAGGAGGTIDASTGMYVGPNDFSSDPDEQYDTIRVTDYDDETAEARILVGTPLMLFCEIIQQWFDLADGRVYLWDQKIMQPKDAGLYVAVSMPMAKPFGNSNRMNADGEVEQFVAMQGTVDIDLISRDATARDRKEEIILALESNYARFQQDANSFSIGKLSTHFVNLSEVDGAAIPYRYRVSVQMQYAYTKASESAGFDTFALEGEVNAGGPSDQTFELEIDAEDTPE